MNLVITGHRPRHIPFDREPWIKEQLAACLGSLEPGWVAVSGMAQGVDQWFVEAAFGLGIPVIAAVPFLGQESVWRTADQVTYHAMLKRCIKVETLNNRVPRDRSDAAKMLLNRNTWMANRAHLGLAIWDRTKTGGTSHCVSELVERKIPTMVLDPRTKTHHVM